MKDLFLAILTWFRPSVAPPASYTPPQPTQTATVIPTPPSSTPPALLWDTKDNVRHSIRVIGDSFLMTPHMKDLLCDIARCESGFNPNAKLINSPKSIDRGLYQWNSYYHPEITDAIAYDPEQNTRIACKAVLARKATVYWSASKFCWNIGGKYDDII